VSDGCRYERQGVFLVRRGGHERTVVSDRTKEAAMSAQASPDISTEGALAPLAGATAWLNTWPLTASEPRGRVVLVSFWTYT
jgi:hypothetical protein